MEEITIDPDWQEQVAEIKALGLTREQWVLARQYFIKQSYRAHDFRGKTCVQCAWMPPPSVNDIHYADGRCEQETDTNSICENVACKRSSQSYIKCDSPACPLFVPREIE